MKESFRVPMKFHTASYREVKSKSKTQTKFPQVLPDWRTKAYKRLQREKNSVKKW